MHFSTVMLNLVESDPQATYTFTNSRLFPFKGLSPIRQWLNRLEIRNAAVAHFICRTIPTQCPFERDICLLGLFTVHIPPLCKLNPLYEEVVGLRFRALCHLADDCHEDVHRYC
ncbi:MAG: Mo-dependent nitrogenase C-terminal domain-containing protein [Phormidesmis sp.]